MKKYSPHYVKLMISLITTLLTLTSLTISTMAWLSTSRDGFVDNIVLGIGGGSLIEVSLDGINFSSEISGEQISGLLDEEFGFNDVTSNDGFTFTHIKSTSSVIINRDFISIPIWFRTSDIYLSNLYLANNISSDYTFDQIRTIYQNQQTLLGTYAISKGVTWSSDITFDNGGDVPVKKGDTAIYYGADSIRFGFRELNVDTPFVNQPDLRTDLISKIFDPSGNHERGFGQTFGAYNYYFIKNNIALQVPPIPQTYYQFSKFKNPYQAITDDSHIATFQLGSDKGRQYGYAKVQLSVWLEGWDPDCFDAIYDDVIIIQFNFQCANPT